MAWASAAVVVCGAPGWSVWGQLEVAEGIEATAVEPRLVTPGGAGELQTTPGVELTFGSLFSTPLNVDGVADLIISVPGVGSFRCTGTLLDGGTQVLTAAHCLDASNTATLEPGTTVNVFFDTPGGTVFNSAATITLHPDYTGNLTGGNDLAMLTLASAVPTSVPRYDIYRGADGVGLGEPRLKVGYGQSGAGQTGATTGAGTKRAGVNSYDFDAAGVLAAFGGGSNPFGGPLPDVLDTLAFDFDSGSSSNDAFGQVFSTSGLADTGFGAFEVNSAPGDSGGPTFIEANDSTLTLGGGGDLGVMIVGADASATLTIDRAGRNTTDYALTVAGDAAVTGTAVETFVEADDLSDFKVLGVTSYGFGLSGLPDVSPGTDSSFGEFSVDSSATAEQAFIDSIGGAVAPAGAASRTVEVTLDTSTAGDKAIAVTLDNLAATSELPGQGSSDVDDLATVTATVLDASNASFDSASDVDSVSVDFGIVTVGSGVVVAGAELFNLESTAGFTSALDVDAVTADAGSATSLSTDLGVSAGLAAGGSVGFSVALDPSAVGLIDAAWDVAVSDEDVAGETTTVLADAIVATAVVTFGGDANLDFMVDTGDLSILAMNFNQAVNGWEDGDFNGDGVVDTGDLAILALQFGQGVGAAVGLAGAVAVPEPGVVAGVMLGVGLAMGRRRRGG